MTRLTLFACPKPFTDPQIRQIQLNAIGSWVRLSPRPEVLLLGDESGTAELATELGIRHIPDLERTPSGTPLVNSIFRVAGAAASHSHLCYVNADIILMDDFMEAAGRVISATGCFLMSGQRWDIELTEALNFQCPGWQEDFRRQVKEKGTLHSVAGLDYFLFRSGFWGRIPAFALGRTAWDNWLVYRARELRAPVVDATEVVMAVHQNHDYTHVPGGFVAVWKGTEAKQNKELAAEKRHFTLLDANWLLTSRGLMRACTRRHFYRALDSWPVLYPGWSVPLRWLRRFVFLARTAFSKVVKGRRSRPQLAGTHRKR